MDDKKKKKKREKEQDRGLLVPVRGPGAWHRLRLCLHNALPEPAGNQSAEDGKHSDNKVK